MSRKHERYVWFQVAATHIWRTYFRYQEDGREPDTPSKQYTFTLCRTALSEQAESFQKFLKEYFLTQWGQDELFVTFYSIETGISEHILWRTVHDVNRRVFELAGLIDPK